LVRRLFCACACVRVCVGGGGEGLPHTLSSVQFNPLNVELNPICWHY
jgi:hypothetical protein